MSKYTKHPYHKEKYDEFRAWTYSDIPATDRCVIVEDRRVLDNNGDISSFSLIFLFNASPGKGFKPLVEIQHETRKKYSNSINLKRDGTIIWDLDNNFRRVKDFPCDHQPDFRNKSDYECYKIIIDGINEMMESLFTHHPRFKNNG